MEVQPETDVPTHTTESLLAHADSIQKPGEWLELPDLVLYACTSGASLKLVINADGEWLETSAFKFISEILGTDSLGGLTRDEAAEWVCVLTPLSFQLWDQRHVPALNHWLPAFRIDSAADPQRLRSMARTEIERLRALGMSDAAVRGFTWSDYLLLPEKLPSQYLFTVKALEHGFCCWDVPGDGDCGVHSLVALLQDAMQP